MSKVVPPAEGDARPPEGNRAEWTRPALHKLKVSGAAGKQKKSMDGATGKGVLS